MKVKQDEGSGVSGDYTWSGLGSDYNEDQNGVRVAKFMPPFNLKMAIFWNYFWEDSRDICKGNFCFLRILSHFNMEVFEIWGGEELCNSVRSCQCPHERLYIKVKGCYVETHFSFQYWKLVGYIEGKKTFHIVLSKNDV